MPFQDYVSPHTRTQAYATHFIVIFLMRSYVFKFISTGSGCVALRSSSNQMRKNERRVYALATLNWTDRFRFICRRLMCRLYEYFRWFSISFTLHPLAAPIHWLARSINSTWFIVRWKRFWHRLSHAVFTVAIIVSCVVVLWIIFWFVFEHRSIK